MSRPKLQFCGRGHDTFVTGRYPSRACKECLKITCAAWRVAKAPKASATARRYYQQHRETYIASAKARRLANPALHRYNVKKNQAKYKGVNFWVEAAKESV